MARLNCCRRTRRSSPGSCPGCRLILKTSAIPRPGWQRHSCTSAIWIGPICLRCSALLPCVRHPKVRTSPSGIADAAMGVDGEAMTAAAPMVPGFLWTFWPKGRSTQGPSALRHCRRSLPRSAAYNGRGAGTGSGRPDRSRGRSCAVLVAASIVASMRRWPSREPCDTTPTD